MILSDDINKCNTLLTKPLPSALRLSVCSDSRKLKEENCFLSLYGDNFDSINFLPDVLEKGVEVVLIENRNDKLLSKIKKDFPKVWFVEVENIFSFILELGRVRSDRFQENGGVIFGLTGSNGKTTNKEILRSLLSLLGEEKVHATEGNLNNQIGVPLTLFEIKDEHEVAVIEMGTNFPGEIKVLSECSHPQYGFITNVGYAHIEFLKSLDGVFEEKTALYREVKNHHSGLFLINGFDEKLKVLKGQEKTEFLGHENLQLEEDGFTLKWKNGQYSVTNPSLLGDHQKINMAMCMVLTLEAFPFMADKIEEKAKSYRAPEMNRGEIREVFSKKVYLDAYNANPSSMRASLDTFMEYLKRQGVSPENALPILGDMNELGESGDLLHQEIGKLLAQKGFNEAYFVGRFSEYYAKGFGHASKSFKNAQEVKNILPSVVNSHEILFIKGSRSLQLESILDING